MQKLSSKPGRRDWELMRTLSYTFSVEEAGHNWLQLILLTIIFMETR